MEKHQLHEFAIKYKVSSSNQELETKYLPSEDHESIEVETLGEEASQEIDELERKIGSLSDHCFITDNQNGTKLEVKKEGKKVVISPVEGDLPRFCFYCSKENPTGLNVYVDPDKETKVTLQNLFSEDFRKIEPSGRIEYVLKLFPEMFQ